MKSEIKLYCILLLMGMSCPGWADFTVTKVGDSVVDPTALTLDRTRMPPVFYSTCVNVVHCQQEAVVTHENHQYVDTWGMANYMLADYDEDTSTWIRTREISSGEGEYQGKCWPSGESVLCKIATGYPHGYDYGPLGRLHVTWVWSTENDNPGTSTSTIDHQHPSLCPPVSGQA